MKQFIAFLAVVGILFTCTEKPFTGSGDDVNTGSLFGMLLTDGKAIDDTVEVRLYVDEGGLAKVASDAPSPLQTMITHDGSYEFDSLPAGVYRIEVIEDSILIGERNDIELGPNERQEVNITLVIIINQTFNIWTEENRTVGDIHFDNGKIVKTDSGYVLVFAESDSFTFEIEIEGDGDTETMRVRTIRHDDGSVTFEIVEDLAGVAITCATTDTTLLVPAFSVDASASTIADGDTIAADSVRIALNDDTRNHNARFRWKADSSGWSTWWATGEPTQIFAWHEITPGVHVVNFEATCLGGVDTLRRSLSFVVVTGPEITGQSDSLIEVVTGESFALAVAAEGTGPLHFTWYKDGTVITASHDDSLRISAASSDDAGVYTCNVGNRWGETASNAMRVVVTVQYWVGYDGNGNTGGAVPVDENTYKTGAKVTVLGNNGSLVKAGHSFITWNSTADGSGVDHAPGTVITIDSTNMTLYAKWTANSFTVTFNSRGGSAVAVQTVAYGGFAAIPAAPARTDFHFAGWFSDTAGTQAWNFATTAVTANITLYALWTQEILYSVIYSVNGADGGSAPIDTSHYTVGDTVTVLGNTESMARAGYTFTGWNSTAGGDGTGYASGSIFIMDTANVLLYAQWTAGPSFTVIYDGNGNTGGAAPVDNNHYAPGATATIMGNTGSMVRTGYLFLGWNTATDGSGADYAAGAIFAIETADVTLYAKWGATGEYTVTYYGNGNTGGAVPSPTTHQSGHPVVVLPKPASLVRTGYCFTGWNTENDGTGTGYSEGSTFTMGTGNVDLYAQWGINRYTVTYSGNGHSSGNPPAAVTQDYNTTVTVAGNSGALKRTGYTFTGWNSVAEGDETDFDTGSIFTLGAADDTLYAKWEINRYSVTYNGNGHTTGYLPSGALYDYHATVNISARQSLIRPGYTFTGWNTASDGSDAGHTAGSSFVVDTNDVTLYAQWNAVSVAYGMVLINARDNSFQMGIPVDVPPVHTVQFTHDFMMDSTEVTQAEYAARMAAYYSGFTSPLWPYSGDDYPAYSMNWYDAVLYCNARTRHAGSNDTVYSYTSITGIPGNDCEIINLSIDLTKTGFRLPTEAEWEYACRGGTTTDFYWGKDYDPYPANAADSNEMNYYIVWERNSHNAGSGYGPQQVAQKLSNAFNLYEITGNIMEWCNDWYGNYSSSPQQDPAGIANGTSRVLRGGSWDIVNFVADAMYVKYYRSGARLAASPDKREDFIGFRAALPIR